MPFCSLIIDTHVCFYYFSYDLNPIPLGKGRRLETIVAIVECVANRPILLNRLIFKQLRPNFSILLNTLIFKQLRPNLKNLSRGSNMVGSTQNCIQFDLRRGLNSINSDPGKTILFVASHKPKIV